MTETNKVNDLHEIFLQNYNSRVKSLKSNQTRFAYYTSAETAFKIIKDKALWMRNVSTMNDFSEIEHGLKCIKNAMASPTGTDFIETIDHLFDSHTTLCSNAFKGFEKISDGGRIDTFVTCFSEHRDTEDQSGRLSMWRGYGGNNGVALIFKSNPFLYLLDAYNISTSPVAYLDQAELVGELNKILVSVMDNIDFMKKQNPQDVHAHLWNMFYFATLCNKHPGFIEEKEWRLIYSLSKDRANSNNPEKKIQKITELVKGVPQVVFRLSLTEELELGDVLDSIIIGPCEFPSSISNGLRTLLEEEQGIPFGKIKIIKSNIPLRYSS